MGVRKKNMADQLKADRKQRAFAKLTNCPTSPRKMRLVADQVRGVEVEEAGLYVKTVCVDSAGMLKRLRPAPQGRAHRIRKRSNHVTLELGSKNLSN